MGTVVELPKWGKDKKRAVPIGTALFVSYLDQVCCLQGLVCAVLRDSA